MSYKKIPVVNSSQRAQQNQVSSHPQPSASHPQPNVYNIDGTTFVRTIVHLDPDSDLFMKVAQRAYQDHERSLVPCGKCGRKFFPDRIAIHEKNCSAAAARLQPNPYNTSINNKIPQTSASSLGSRHTSTSIQQSRARKNTEKLTIRETKKFQKTKPES